MNLDVDDDFYDEFFDNLENIYSSSCKIKNGINVTYQSYGSTKNSFQKKEPKFVPLKEDSLEVKEIIQNLPINAIKIKEVLNYFNNCMSDDMKSKKKILLLSGPTGCGKTLLIEAMAKIFEFDIQTYEQSEIELLNGDEDSRYSHSASENFIKFINYCNFESKKLTSKGVKKTKLIIIEEIPNFLYINPTIFANEISDLLRVSIKPIFVFIMNSSYCSWKYNFNRIFTQKVIENLEIKHIKLLAVAKTFMIKNINMYTKERGIAIPTISFNDSKKRKNNSNGCLEKIVEMANGDLRQARVIIDFCSVKNNYSSSVKRSKMANFALSIGYPIAYETHEKTLDYDLLSILKGGRHVKSEMFHFLGKILYAKRLNEGVSVKQLNTIRSIEDKLSPKLKAKKRFFPLKEDIEELVKDRVISGQKLEDYIFEHEIMFVPDLRSLSNVYEVLFGMNAAFGMSEHRFSDELENYMYDITCRSVMYYNYGNDNNLGFYKFDKPLTNFKDIQSLKEETLRKRQSACEKLNDIVCLSDLIDYQLDEKFYQDFYRLIYVLFTLLKI